MSGFMKQFLMVLLLVALVGSVFMLRRSTDSVKPLDDEVEGTDRWAFTNNWVSVTPLRLDLTAEKDLTRALSLRHTPALSTKREPIRRTRKKRQQRRLGPE